MHTLLDQHTSCGALLDLDDVKQALGLVAQHGVPGIRPIPVDHIVGTVGRCCDFDRSFHPLRRDIRDRMRRVHAAFPDGAFPPIVVYQIDEVYFVSDGHHRVALARANNVDFIDAEVTRIHASYRLEPDVSPAEIEMTGHERVFLAESGLTSARPTARIPMTSSAGYTELLESVKAHGYDLVQREARPLSPAQVAAHWYDCVYQPTVRTAEAAGLPELLPSCREGDLFLGLHRSHRRSFGSECAAAEDAIQQTVEEERQQLTPPRRGPFRRLLPRRRRPPPVTTLPRRT